MTCMICATTDSAAARAEQLATLGRLSHEALTSDEIGRLLDTLAPFAEDHPYDSDEASLIRIVRRDWDKARRVPAELRAEIARAGSLAMPVWVKARQESDYKQFIPALRTNLELRRRYIECFDDYDEPYDVLLDDFDLYPDEMLSDVARRLGFGEVPMVCARELDIAGSMPRVVRMLAHVETDRPRADITHVYLHGAAALRRDLTRVREVPDDA